MPVYSGTLREIGPGTVAFGARNSVRRSFVDIGDHHLLNVISSEYVDAYLQKGIGGQTSISVWKMMPFGKIIVAVRLPDGQRRRDEEAMVVMSMCLIIAAVGVVGGIFGAFFFGLFFGGIVLPILIFLGMLIGYPIVGIRSFLSARQAV